VTLDLTPFWTPLIGVFPGGRASQIVRGAQERAREPGHIGEKRPLCRVVTSPKQANKRNKPGGLAYVGKASRLTPTRVCPQPRSREADIRNPPTKVLPRVCPQPRWLAQIRRQIPNYGVCPQPESRKFRIERIESRIPSVSIMTLDQLDLSPI
jgi:hypothetical protein